jgi:hypothetical protein
MHKGITMHQVSSSHVESVGHHNGDVLRVTFKGGATYDYPGVSADTFQDLKAADSPGKFIRGLGVKGTKVVKEDR